MSDTLFEAGTEKVVKIILNKRKYPLTMTVTDDGLHIEFKSGFNRAWTKEVKESFDSPKWCGMETAPRKNVWRVTNAPRSRFRLKFLLGLNPYQSYDAPLRDWDSERPLYDHQKEMAAHWYDNHYCIYACEMGTGKSLASLEVVERILDEQKLINPWQHVWYVGPKTGVSAFTREIKKWDFKFNPRIFTYGQLTKAMKDWAGHLPTPRMLIIDECSQIKTWEAQRTKAVAHLTEAIINEWGDKGYVVEMSGTPAPKDPSDWHAPCEIACPGFIREGSKQKFKNRMCIIEARQSLAGGTYPHIVTWLDDENKCATCGELEDHIRHKTDVMDPITMQVIMNANFHPFKKSVNEVAFLYERMQGLVLVKFKKDCLDLPEKLYEVIRVKPNPQTIRALNLIKSTSTRAVTALIRARTLSDGFQYTEEKVGEETCETCRGEGETKIFKLVGVDENADSFTKEQAEAIEEVDKCPTCGGKGRTPVYARARDDCHSPKDDAMMELISDQFEQYGRVVVWAGFSGSIDKLVELLHKHDWATLRYDAKVEGSTSDGKYLDKEMLLDALDASHPKYTDLLRTHPKIAFIGNPRAGGMGLTLTASPGAIYYSNDFSGEARIQSEDRVHRAGMDKNRACTIYDLIHLPTDMLVLENLRKKRTLQNMTMGELSEAMK